MGIPWNRPFLQFLFGLYIRLAFIVLNAALLPVLLIGERFIDRADRPALWCLAAHRNTLLLLRLMKVRLHLKAPLPRHDVSVIFVSNHPSMLDGFILFALLGPNLVPLTAPFDSFMFPFNIWFAKMGAVDVLRDGYDEKKFRHGSSTHGAIKKMVRDLQQQHNVLIFPEGHVERTHKLHYIHTGAARVALRSKRPIQPLSLIGLEKIMIGNVRVKPGVITVRCGELLPPPQMTAELPYRKAVKEFSKGIEHAMISLLPVRYLPSYVGSYTPPETIGAFIDIDHTMYTGYSQQDFVKYLFRHKKLSPWIAFRIFHWVLLEKFHALPHRQLMRLSFSIMKGWKVREVERLAKKFFREYALSAMQKHMLPVIKDHVARGHVIVLVTEVMQPLAKQFQTYVGATACLDTVLEEHGGVYTGRVERLCYQKQKAQLVRHCAEKFGINLRRSYVYADSISDVPMLELVGHKTAVHPDTELLQKAQRLGWAVLT